MSEKTTILTAALPYANGDIHVGHLVEYVQADIFARHLRLQGETCYFLCADDAHGAPIQMRAEDERVTPLELIGRMKSAHERDFAAFDISFDIYHSTHSPENKELVTVIYGKLRDAGAIVLNDIDQLFDEQEQRFLADRYVRGTCPRCGLKDQPGDSCQCGATYDALSLIDPVSVRTGAAPVIRKSTHLFFDVPRYAAFLETWRRSVGLQASVNNKLDEWFAQGLRRWDISRDAPYFGFEIPDFPGKYFYVWLDAPVGYLAALKRLCGERNLDFDALLNDGNTDLVHFIGKDIAYFHTVFWPAILHAAGMRLPAAIRCHGFLTVNGAKMSKSTGTLIPAAALAKAADPSFFRYFLFSMLDDGLDDINLDLGAFRERVNADLVGKIVNIGSRSAKLLHDVAGGEFTCKLRDDPRFDHYCERLAVARSMIGERRYAGACRAIIAQAESTNRWLAELAPWTLAKGDPVQRNAAAEICTQALFEFRAVMISLAAVTPTLAERACSLFRQADQSISAWSYASIDPRISQDIARLAPFDSLLRRLEESQLGDLVKPPSPS